MLTLNEYELRETNGGMAHLAGAGAVAAGCGMVLGAIIVGAAIGAGIYYGVKWLANK